MKLAMKEDVLNIRAQTSSNDVAFACSKDDDAAAEEDSGFWIGIAHLLTPASMKEVMACRARCKRAVLAELSPFTFFSSLIHRRRKRGKREFSSTPSS